MAEPENLADLKIDKHEAKGTCLTCRRGFFDIFFVWCMHPTRPEGYKAHSPVDSCPGYEFLLKNDFKQLARILTIQRNEKYVNPYVKDTPNGGVEIHVKNRIINGNCSGSSGTKPDKVSTDSKLPKPKQGPLEERS